MIKGFTENKAKYTAAIIGALVIYSLLSYFLLEKDPLSVILNSLFRAYFSMAEITGAFLLHLFGSSAVPENLNTEDSGLIHQVGMLKYKKIPFVALILIWLTRTETRDKLLFTLATVLIHFLAFSTLIAVDAQSPVLGGNKAYLLTRSHHMISVMLLFSVFFVWYLKKKDDIRKTMSAFRIKAVLFHDNAIPLFVACYLFILIDNFPVELNSYLPWINAIFLSAQKILGLLGYEASIDQFSLIGENGMIVMRKGCLGIGAMFLFSAVVYLTGSNNKTRWSYIITGVILLNLVNVVRFVLLFIYIQTHEVDQTMDVHATYGYIIYSIIFIMWILWFEKFSDLKKSR